MKIDKSIYSNYYKDNNLKFAEITNYQPELANLVTFSRSTKYPIHNWFYYKQGYSPEIVEYFIKKSNLNNKSVILDPFCGVGTTLLTCKNLGFNSIGVDIMPLATFISEVKLRDDFNIESIKKEFDKIMQIPIGTSISKWPDVQVISRAFDEKTKNEIMFLKDQINEITIESTKNLLLLALISIIGDVSNTKKDGGFLRIVNDKPKYELKNLFNTKVKKMISDISQSSLNLVDHRCNSTVMLGDARNIPEIKKDSIDLVMTSPPYLNKTDYTRIYSLELCLAFVDNFDELKKIRYNSIRSNVEARYHKMNIELPQSLLDSLDNLNQRQLSNPKHPDMISGYFEDIHLTLKEMYRVMKPGSKGHIVNWTSRFSGVSFDVDIITAEMAESIGFTVEQNIIARQKGTSAQQNKKYGEKPLRETIVVFSKP